MFIVFLQITTLPIIRRQHIQKLIAMRLFGHDIIRNEQTNRKHKVNILWPMTGTLLWNWERDLKQIYASLLQRRKMFVWIVTCTMEDNIDGSLNRKQLVMMWGIEKLLKVIKKSRIEREKKKTSDDNPCHGRPSEKLMNWMTICLAEHYFT